MSVQPTFPANPDPGRRCDPVFTMHRGGKISVRPVVDVTDHQGLAMAYTPGVARVCKRDRRPTRAGRRLHLGVNTVAVVTDGTAVLGLGDIGPAAAMPVMEGKAMLFKRVRRHRRGADLPGRTRTPRRSSRRSPRSRRASAASTWRTSPRRAASRSRTGSGAARHPGLPRRPARHGDRGAGRAAQRGPGGGQGTRPAPSRRGRRRRGRRGGDENAAPGRDRRHRHLGQQGPDLPGRGKG